MAKKIKIDPSLKMQVCGWAGLIGMGIMQVWHDNPDLVRIGMFLVSLGSSAGVLMARHRHVTDEQSGATERFYREHFEKHQAKQAKREREHRHD